jgi:hypothetical protein
VVYSNRRSALFLPIIILIVATGSVFLIAAQGSKRVWRPNFWNYFIRGQERFDAGELGEAEADFLQAIKHKSDDDAHARTYGVQFIAYYPHRELGVVYLEQEKLIEAEEQFKLSQSTAPSAKADYYLEKVTQLKLLKEHKDETPPGIEVSFPPHHSDIYINSFDTELSGSLTDDLRVARMDINGERVHIKPGEKSSFKYELKGLSEGANPVSFKVSDVAGKKTTQNHVVQVDLNAPTISVFPGYMEPNASGGFTVALRGDISDDHLLNSLEVGGKKLDVYKKKSIALQDYKFTVASATQAIAYRATDLAGNEVSGNIRLAPKGVAAPLTASADKTPPVMEKPPEQSIYFTEMSSLEIAAVDDGQIVQLLIDGNSQSITPGPSLFTRVRRKLEVGDNDASITIVDAAGNRVERNINVTRIEQSVKSLDSRLSFALLDFEYEGDASTEVKGFADRLTGKIVEGERFGLTENGTPKASIADLKKLAQELEVDGFITGKITARQNAVDILINLLSPDGKIVKSYDAYDEDVSNTNLRYLAGLVHEKMLNDFPLLDGTVAQIKGKKIYLTFKGPVEVNALSRCIIYRDGEVIKDPSTGKPLGSLPDELGEAQLVKAKQPLIMAQLDKIFEEAVIKPGDLVISK